MNTCHNYFMQQFSQSLNIGTTVFEYLLPSNISCGSFRYIEAICSLHKYSILFWIRKLISYIKILKTSSTFLLIL